MELICTIDTFNFPVKVLDPSGNLVATCDKKNSRLPCRITHRGGEIYLDYENRTIEIILLNESEILDGKWVCQNGEATVETYVSYSEGNALEYLRHIYQ